MRWRAHPKLGACTQVILLLDFKNSLAIHEGNTKEISTMTVTTLYLIKLIEY